MVITMERDGVKNSLDHNEEYCTLVQVESMNQGDYPMRRPTDKTATDYYRLLNKKDLAGLLNCAERTIERMIAAKQVPFTMIPCGPGGRLKRRFVFGEIVEWLERHSTPCKQNAGTN